MSGAHTPTPYVVNGFGGDFHVVAGMQPHEVAISSRGARGGEIETASFIVRACNSHDALVAALESLKSHSKWLHLVAERLQKQQRDYSIANTCEEAADAIDAALKAAKAQP